MTSLARPLFDLIFLVNDFLLQLIQRLSGLLLLPKSLFLRKLSKQKLASERRGHSRHQVQRGTECRRSRSAQFALGARLSLA
ncbi:MAG: hypothetical protein HY290_21280, partial [Planctomycetia bacterium]|nr:hypothetical protein [Planctomycetia bacterium]